ncbi:hypothetical protein [Gephyromycinifex aptenodytis]|uniref:hypothetical protein n=1 Tax=Gephyromycinifex aptenodytis TaxID=2716227 RepID=UPI001B2FFBB8|nr:hypothetical protein [Gephyromycinifex aptenodytis]
MTSIPAVLRGLCDDAAIFPPGNKPLVHAVPDHILHHRSDYAALVGPFIISAAKLVELPPLLSGLPRTSLAVSVTVPSPQEAQAVITSAALLPPLRLAGLEIAVPDSMSAEDVIPALGQALAGVDVEGGGLGVYVEIPRDHRRSKLIDLLAGTPYRAKFRTGGIRADLYPSENELAGAIQAVVRAGIAFKATAGLHHAVRNTEPEHRFEQHGFLNVMLATDAAAQGAERSEIAELLGERNGPTLAERLRALPTARAERLRASFRSYGTCSIDEPLAELLELGLIDRRAAAEQPEPGPGGGPEVRLTEHGRHRGAAD